jgi:uncharacterized protein (DUF2164 family)
MKNKKNNSASGRGDIFIENDDLQWLAQSHRWEADGESEGDGQTPKSKDLECFVRKPVVEKKEIDIERLMEITSGDIIDKFLRTETRRIVAEEGDVEAEITTEADLAEEDDMVSEELAEVYLAQGLKDMAIETYRKLSLRNPEKSIYFAEIISKIEN